MLFGEWMFRIIIVIRVADGLLGVVRASNLSQTVGTSHVLLRAWVSGFADAFAGVPTLSMVTGRRLVIRDGLLTVIRADGLDHVIDVVELWFAHHGSVPPMSRGPASVVVRAASMLMRAALRATSRLPPVPSGVRALEGEMSNFIAVPAAPFFFRVR